MCMGTPIRCDQTVRERVSDPFWRLAGFIAAPCRAWFEAEASTKSGCRSASGSESNASSSFSMLSGAECAEGITVGVYRIMPATSSAHHVISPPRHQPTTPASLPRLYSATSSVHHVIIPPGHHYTMSSFSHVMSPPCLHPHCTPNDIRMTFDDGAAAHRRASRTGARRLIGGHTAGGGGVEHR